MSFVVSCLKDYGAKRRLGIREKPDFEAEYTGGRTEEIRESTVSPGIPASTRDLEGDEKTDP
jgi:hypothetical protein